LSFGIETKAGQLNSKKGLEKAIAVVIDEENKIIVETIVSAIKKLSVEIKDIEEKLKKMASGDRAVEILQSIPGTGLLNAITVRAYIDDIKRFSHYNKLSAYCGLVPWVKCSDEKMQYGKITKRGPVELRTAIIQMVLGMIRCKDERNNRFMIAYRNMKKIKGSGKSLVATGRKFTKLIWAILTKDEEFNKEKTYVALKDDLENISSYEAA